MKLRMKVEESEWQADRHVGEYGVVSDIDNNNAGTYTSSQNALDGKN